LPLNSEKPPVSWMTPISTVIQPQAWRLKNTYRVLSTKKLASEIAAIP
jgi:hypothetical protein